MVPADAVQTEIRNDLSNSWLYLFSKNTLFTYPASAIRANILKEYPAAQSVDFQSRSDIFGFGNNVGLQVFITERSPFALACDAVAVKDATSSQACFYMDSTGFVYAQAPLPFTGNYIQYELSSTMATIIPGTFLTDPATFTLAQKIIGAVSGTGLTVVGDVIDADAYGPVNQIIVADGQSSAASSTPKTTSIYFNGSEPLETELRYFSEFWAQEATSSAITFQYVDMRYGKDIVFKVYSNAPNSAVSASSTKTKK